MMLVELLLMVALLIALVSFGVILVEHTKSDYSRNWWIAKVLNLGLLTAIEVGFLTVHCLSGKSYGFNLFLTLLWLFNLVLEAIARSND